MPQHDDVADRLYALPPELFVRERDAEARRLREAGQAEAARAVASLKKPTVAAWAANQVARREPAVVEELLRAGEALRRAQRRTVSGLGASELREAVAARRAAVERGMEVAEQALGERGPTAGPHLDEVAATLEAASAEEEAGALLRRGRLSRPLPPPSGFGTLGGLEVVPDTHPGAVPAGGPRGAEGRGGRRAREEREAEEREAEAVEARRRAARAERAARKAQEDHRRAAAAAERAEEDAREAVERAGRARDLAEDAARRAREARAEADREARVAREAARREARVAREAARREARARPARRPRSGGG